MGVGGGGGTLDGGVGAESRGEGGALPSANVGKNSVHSDGVRLGIRMISMGGFCGKIKRSSVNGDVSKLTLRRG